MREIKFGTSSSSRQKEGHDQSSLSKRGSDSDREKSFRKGSRSHGGPFLPPMSVSDPPPSTLLRIAAESDKRGEGLLSFYSMKARYVAHSLRIDGASTALEDEVRDSLIKSLSDTGFRCPSLPLHQEILSRARSAYARIQFHENLRQAPYDPEAQRYLSELIAKGR